MIGVSALVQVVARQITHVICPVMEQEGGTRDASAISDCP